MKKNKLMRLASVLLVLTLLTTCVIGGTYAKYITSDSAHDVARVAKFGVVASVSGDLFSKSYAKTSNTPQAWEVNMESVSSFGANEAAAELLVAPGTKNDKGMTFVVKGTPEVSTKLTVDAVEGTTTGTGGNNNKDFVNTDIFLVPSVYSVMVEVSTSNVAINADNCGDYRKLEDGVFSKLASSDLSSLPATVYHEVPMLGDSDAEVDTTMGAAYYPLKWKVNNGTDITSVADLYTALQNALTGTTGTATATKLPNETWSQTAVVTWAWPFGSEWTDIASDTTLHNWENTTKTDLEDTILGDMIALAKANNTGLGYLIACDGELVKYAEIDANSTSANKVWVAYVGESAPSAWSGGVACLTVSFGARVTVEQVD